MDAPRLQSPIVMVHGLLGFDKVKLLGWTVANYFSHLPDRMRAAGNKVLVSRLSPTGGVENRARQLKDLLDRELPNEPVHIIAHSMGGLDARYLISRLGQEKRVRSLTTLGTPHRGTAFADWGVKRFERIVKPMLDYLGLPNQAFYDLTTEHCQRFNEKTPDAPNVRYFSVAGVLQRSWDAPEWLLSRSVVEGAEGANDGIVSVASATYGEACDQWTGDHISLINWRSPLAQIQGKTYDRTADYDRLLQRLAEIE